MTRMWTQAATQIEAAGAPVDADVLIQSASSEAPR
jgi:hypothetical protein